MKPVKILYVDDEAMALKYFERLVSPLAPVITASSVEEGRAMLAAHGAEVAVLVCDQRMPGEYGNELLRHAREYYPGVVRMLTTAYSELGDAIEFVQPQGGLFVWARLTGAGGKLADGNVFAAEGPNSLNQAGGAFTKYSAR